MTDPLVVLNSWLLVRLVHRFPADDGAQDAGAKDLLRRNGGQVAVEHNEVREHTGGERPLFFFREFRIGCAGGVGCDCLFYGQFLSRIVRLPPVFALACNGSIQAAKRTYGFDRVISAERQSDSMIQKVSPRVRMRSPLWTKARLGPVHVSEKMARLHGGNNVELLEA